MENTHICSLFLILYCGYNYASYYDSVVRAKLFNLTKMGKRLQGLGKVSKSKKTKVEDTKPENSTPEPEPEVHIELQDEEDEELAEVYGLYSKLKADRDPRLARGLVHESNELLRSRDEKNKELPAMFHVVYAGGLLTLATEDKSFAEAAFERLNTGLSAAGPKDTDVIGIAVFELIQYAHTQVDLDKKAKLSKNGSKAFNQAIDLLTEYKSSDDVELARAVALLVGLLEDTQLEVDLPILKSFEKSSDPESKRLGNKCLGQLLVNKLEPKLELLGGEESEEDEDEDDDEEDNDEDNDDKKPEVDPKLVAEIKDELEKAIKYLKHATSDLDPDTYVILAETYLSLDEVDEDKDYNEEALKLLKKARMLGVEDLQDTIDSLE